jgi:hypothetical protein
LVKQSEATALMNTAECALCSLTQQLQAAQIIEANTIVNFKAGFIGGKLEGFVDLLIKNEKSKEAVVDLKSGRLWAWIGTGWFQSSRLRGFYFHCFCEFSLKFIS